jgi:hypothetical protein
MNMTTNQTTTLSGGPLLMIQRFRDANPDKRDRHMSAAEFLRKNHHRIRGISPLLEMAGFRLAAYAASDPTHHESTRTVTLNYLTITLNPTWLDRFSRVG